MSDAEKVKQLEAQIAELLRMIAYLQEKRKDAQTGRRRP